MKKIKAEELNDEHKGSRISFTVEGTVVIGVLEELDPYAMGTTTLYVRGIFGSIDMDPETPVTIFGTF